MIAVHPTWASERHRQLGLPTGPHAREREIYLGVERDLYARQGGQHKVEPSRDWRGGGAAAVRATHLAIGRRHFRDQRQEWPNQVEHTEPCHPCGWCESCGCRPRGATTTWGAERRGCERRGVRRSNRDRKGEERKGKNHSLCPCTRANRGKQRRPHMHLDHVAPF